MGNLAGQPRGVGVRIVVDQFACVGGKRTLTILEVAICKRIFSRIGSEIALRAQFAQMRTRLVTRLMSRWGVLFAAVSVLWLCASVRLYQVSVSF